MPAHEFPIAREHAAEKLRPGSVHRRIEDDPADLPGAQFLRFRRKAEEGVDFALDKQIFRLRGGIAARICSIWPAASPTSICGAGGAAFRGQLVVGALGIRRQSQILTSHRERSTLMGPGWPRQ